MVEEVRMDAAVDERREAVASSVPPPLRDDHPAPAHARPHRALRPAGWAAIAVTAIAWLVVSIHSLSGLVTSVVLGEAGFGDIVSVGVFLLVIAFLTLSALLYLVTRDGALRRLATHERLPRAALDSHFLVSEPSMTVLVPSYAEEPHVVRATLWSAALQEFPELDVVLLVDDRPDPEDPDARARLERTRLLPFEIQARLREPSEKLSAALDEAERFVAAHPSSPLNAATIADLHEHAVAWLVELADAEQVRDHADQFFVDRVLLSLARDLGRTADRLRTIADDAVPAGEGLALLRRLARIFTVRLDLFERKRYASLSHEANKAMNLNSYIGLMGGEWVVDSVTVGGRSFDVLRAARYGETPDRVVPASDYVLTLDADSLLVPDYCVRLVHEMEQPGNERMAVIQTPYSSYRGARTWVERIAGMTTDLQHLQHQGRTAFDATFWVGANAIIRTEALADIVEVRIEDGPAGPRVVRTYIQDRTVIEETESSMDLVANGWSLHNYPERLSFSATPPDFGSLVVQRRRWANGGLIVLPKLLDVVRGRRRRDEDASPAEVLLRADYLGSTAWTTVGTALLLLMPETTWLLSPLLFVVALPYFATMALDLRTVGHRLVDMPKVFALNLVLLPVNLAGVAQSVEQVITKRKIPFARTPKVADRVAAPALFVVLPYLIGLGLLAFAVLAATRGHWPGVVFAGMTGAAALAGAVAFVGTRSAAQDVAAAWREFRAARAKRPLPARAKTQPLDLPGLRWLRVLVEDSEPKLPALGEQRTGSGRRAEGRQA